MLLAQRAERPVALPRWAFDPLRMFYIVIGIICTASSALAVAQAFGWHPIRQWVDDQSPGLFYNPAAAGAIFALAFIALWVNDLRWWTLGTLPGLALSHSRGGMAALAFGLLAVYFRKPLWLIVLILAFGLALSIYPSSSDTQRLLIWHAAWRYLTFWGNGFGSFWALYMGDPSCCLIHPEYAHNEYLQAMFELGIFAIVPFAIVAWALSRTHARNWPTLATFAFIACFSMPIYINWANLLGALALITTFMESTNA